MNKGMKMKEECNAIERVMTILDEVRKEAWQAGYEFGRLMEGKEEHAGYEFGRLMEGKEEKETPPPPDYNPQTGLPPIVTPIPELKVPQVDLTPPPLPKARRREQ